MKIPSFLNYLDNSTIIDASTFSLREKVIKLVLRENLLLEGHPIVSTIIYHLVCIVYKFLESTLYISAKI